MKIQLALSPEMATLAGTTLATGDAQPALAFVLDCVPTAQQRPKFASRGGFHVAYKSGSQKANERTLEALLMPHMPQNALEGGLELNFIAIMPVPSSSSRKAREGMLQGKIGHTVKPDLDNLAKQLKDAMTRLRFWKDDRQVVRLVCEKRYGEKPCWKVAIRQLCREK